MDSSAISWLSEKVLETPNFKDDEFDFMEFMNEELVALMGEGLETCLSPKNDLSTSSNCLINNESTNSISFSTLCPSSTPMVLNFRNPNSPHQNAQNTNYGDHEEAIDVSQISKSQSSHGADEELPKRAQNMKKTAGRIRPPSQTYDHIVAERRRREQLNRHFLALSTIVPGLKKMDKTSILGDAITHLKYLQERVKILEEESRKKSIESVVFVNETEDHNFEDERTLPEIEAKVCDNQILIKIECEYRKGLLAKVIAQLEKLNLTILTTQATRFGMLILEITIITKMEKEFDSSVNQVLKSLHGAIKACSVNQLAIWGINDEKKQRR